MGKPWPWLRTEISVIPLQSDLVHVKGFPLDSFEDEANDPRTIAPKSVVTVPAIAWN